jgi:dipeptidyl aminopeptidase/acylaminoacyl peptidase
MPDAPLTLEQVLAITYTAGHAWSPDGTRIGFIHDDGGRFSLRVAAADGGGIVEVSQGDRPVTEFGWAPPQGASAGSGPAAPAANGGLAYVQGGTVYLAAAPRPGGPASPGTVLYAPAEPVSGLTWAPTERSLACTSGGRAWVIDLAGPSIRDLGAPGRVRALYHEPPIVWAPDASALAVTVTNGDRWDLAVLSRDGDLLWRSDGDELEGPMAWLRPARLLFARCTVDYTVRQWFALDLAPAPAGAAARDAQGNGSQCAPVARPVWIEREPQGLGAPFPPQPLPDGTGAVLVLRHDGWWHPYLLDAESGTVRALSTGSFEDVGHAADLPRVSPDGREVVVSSNRVDLGQRHLFAVDIETGRTRALTPGPGTSVEPQWSPDGRRIAFKHSTVHHAPELWVVSRAGGDMRRVVGAMPGGVAPERFPLPELVHTRGANDWLIPGYLLTPRPRVPGRRYPALVYIHGGGMRQMRDGFPPLEAYAFFYAVSLWLAGRGIVSYLVNYRGGIGYGRTFEQGNHGGLGLLECEDCVRAGEYVKTLPFVDPARVGVWGLSYGGWLTLASLVRSPQTFALGINIAGIWDFDRWMAWAKEAYRPPYDYFLGRAGTRAQRPDVWDAASPRRLVHRMRAPLVNFHGTKDEAVPFEQLDLIVQDCVAHGKRFETHYYPGESHLFTRRDTWRDALQKVEAALQRHLGLNG